MRHPWSSASIGAACAVVLAAALVSAQQAPPAPAAGRGGPSTPLGTGGARGVGAALYAGIDTATPRYGCATRAAMRTAFDKWFAAADTAKSGSITREQLEAALTPAAPAAPAAAPAGGRGVQNQTPIACDVDLMTAALPDRAPAKPLKPRKILVLGKAAGFVHSSIPLAAKTVEALGTKTKAWTTDVTYDSKDINAENLKQYDLVFLDSTTGAFLDDPNDAAVTAARKQALLEFVRGGKGLAGIHAATDSYHGRAAVAAGAAAPGGGGRGGGGRGNRGGAAPGPGITMVTPPPPPPPTATLAAWMVEHGDRNRDQKLSKSEFTSLADTWFEKIDTDKAGRVKQGDFTQRFSALMVPPAAPAPPAAPRGGAASGAPTVARGSVTTRVGTWPEFNTMIGGFFKYHWNDPQLIHVKIDDPNSPLTAMFKGKPFQMRDETYTFAQHSFSRNNVRVLTSVDYDKMSDADKAQEPAGEARTDGDYALSYIRREGQGRVFYEAHGHSERNYAIKPFLEHILAGIQYALGDLKADDTPSGYGTK
jgi:type 1 glutamine amidotransferase